MDSTVLQEAINAYRPQVTEDDGSFTPLDVALRCIVILADITKLCFDPPEQVTHSTISSPQSRTDKWRGFMTDLLSWYSKRPSNLHALVEDEAPSNTFPAIIFTNAAAVWTHMMYHVSMMVLITHKPASISLRSEHAAIKIDRSHFSGLWHARRVCGIAISSDPRCWDPCMLAAFYLAARRMTQISQQKELEMCLGRVRVAGWRNEGLATRLREEWCLPVAPT